MWMKVLLRFLPADQKSLLELGIRIMSSLDSPEERWAAIKYGGEALKDGRMTVSEWSRLGSILGILKGKH